MNQNTHYFVTYLVTMYIIVHVRPALILHHFYSHNSIMLLLGKML